MALVIVPGVENPQFRNTRLLFSLVFTLQDATLLDEFIARVGSNFETYMELLGGLVLIPQHIIGVRYSVVLRTHPVNFSHRRNPAVRTVPVDYCNSSHSCVWLVSIVSRVEEHSPAHLLPLVLSFAGDALPDSRCSFPLSLTVLDAALERHRLQASCDKVPIQADISFGPLTLRLRCIIPPGGT